MLTRNYTALIKQTSQRLGFDYCGISKAEFLEEESPRLEKWLKDDRHGKMGYMENYFDKRLDPRKLMPGAKSVISLLLNYFPEAGQNNLSHDKPKISKYAYGRDYHFVVKEKLKELIAFLKENIGDVNARAFVDSAPVMDKGQEKGMSPNIAARKILRAIRNNRFEPFFGGTGMIAITVKRLLPRIFYRLILMAGKK